MKCWHLVNSAGKWCWSGWISFWSWCKLQVCFTTLTWNTVIVNGMCSLETRRNLGWGLFWECFPLYYCRVKNPWQAILSLVKVPQSKIRISRFLLVSNKSGKLYVKWLNCILPSSSPWRKKTLFLCCWLQYYKQSVLHYQILWKSCKIQEVSEPG